jgi:hypothetical protein
VRAQSDDPHKRDNGDDRKGQRREHQDDYQVEH